MSLASLEHFLLGTSSTLPSRTLLEVTKLVGYAFVHASPDTPDRSQLRFAYRLAAARHEVTKAELIPLLRAWRDASIDVLLIKGFALAEFEYAASGARHYGDIDIVIHDENTAVAERLARRLGWRVDWRRPPGAWFDHEVLRLVSPSGVAHVEVQRHPTQRTLLGQSRQRRVQRLSWQAARRVTWEGMDVHLLSPVDAVLVPLVLGRAWYCDPSERWVFKPQDYTDMQQLIERHGVTLEAVTARAEQFGARRTLLQVLKILDPWRRHVRLERLTAPERAAFDASIREERGDVELDWRMVRAWDLSTLVLTKFPLYLADMTRELPHYLAVRAMLRPESNVHALFEKLDELPFGSSPTIDVQRVARGVKWTMWLYGKREDVCLPRSLTLYVALRRYGYRPVFVSGVRRVGGAVVGHAWIELDGKPLRYFDAEFVRRRYTVNIEHASP
ncbi:transglutaminase superfamily protein [Deinococcus yavapaiensis KR-236]|uniref:Transglutaminase superfamily protein n=2 Tax=Deinococcus TaxID=1298 RepID=A0A318S693_9DEIO|nr:transglutaminase superfamily protein [Deinococcus yavapaiensis KR-236]